jgi:hypothetical protein
LPAICRTTSGNFLGGVTAYGNPTPFEYTATIANDTVSCTFSGEGFDGDESINIQYRTGFHPFTLSQQAKGNLSAASLYGNLLAGILAALFFTPCDGPCGVGSGVVWAASGLAAIAACDPSDPNFMTIATPMPPSLPPLTVAGTPFTQSEINAFNAFITNEEQIIGVLGAILTSINRAQGASDAGNAFWETKQTQAAKRYEIQLGILFQNEVTLLSNLNNTLTNGGFPTITITANDFLNFEHNVNSNGLPAILVSTLTKLGVDSTTIANIKDILTTEDPNQASGNFPDVLVSAPLIAALQNATSALVPFSGVPGKSNCHGQTVSALANQYGGLNSAASALGFSSVQELQNTISLYCGN